MRLNPRLRRLTSASRTASGAGFTGLRTCGACGALVAASGVNFNSYKHVKTATRRQRQHPRRDFVQRVFADFLAAAQTKCAADARVEQPQIIVNFGGCRHGRARIARGIFLPDRNCGSDPRDFVHVGLFDALEELPRVGRERFDVAALPLCIKSVESEAGFARTRDAADHSDRVVRDHEINILQIVYPCAPDANLLDIRRHRLSRAPRQRARFTRVRRELPYGFRCHVYKQKIIRPTASGGKLSAAEGSSPLRSRCPRRDLRN